jgi:hypothetical protein
MRSLLAWVTAVLLLLVAADRLLGDRAERGPGAGPGARASAAGLTATTAHGSEQATGRAAARPGAGSAGAALAAGSAAEGAGAGDRTLDRRARLAGHRRLSRAGRGTYLDSLILTTDSVVRRWPDRAGVPLRVAIVEGGAAGYRGGMAGLMREALGLWEGAGLGVRFALIPDTAGADIVVRWIDRFPFDRAGQTDLTWDQLGNVHRAAISLAVHTHTGVALPDAALLSVAVHEAGHAIGLPHSSDSADVMFPATRTGALSERDRRTASLLYQLPPGPVRDQIAAAPTQ